LTKAAAAAGADKGWALAAVATTVRRFAAVTWVAVVFAKFRAVARLGYRAAILNYVADFFGLTAARRRR
jgi:hypothetical protein